VLGGHVHQVEPVDLDAEMRVERGQVEWAIHCVAPQVSQAFGVGRAQRLDLVGGEVAHLLPGARLAGVQQALGVEPLLPREVAVVGLHVVALDHVHMGVVDGEAVAS
jgi:hypothetical protein